MRKWRSECNCRRGYYRGRAERKVPPEEGSRRAEEKGQQVPEDGPEEGVEEDEREAAKRPRARSRGRVAAPLGEDRRKNRYAATIPRVNAEAP
jgi:hypothetical protein